MEIKAHGETQSNLKRAGSNPGAIDLSDAVTYAKIQNVSATDRLLGRDSSGAGIIEEIAPSAVRTMLNNLLLQPPQILQMLLIFLLERLQQLESQL